MLSMYCIVWVLTFHDGNEKYKILQKNVFVVSETVSESSMPGYFYVDIKINKIFCVNMSIVMERSFRDNNVQEAGALNVAVLESLLTGDCTDHGLESDLKTRG